MPRVSEDHEDGGFERIRPKSSKGDREDGGKVRDRRDRRPTPPIEPPVIEPQATPASQPAQIRQEERKMGNVAQALRQAGIQQGTGQAQGNFPEKESCPVCGTLKNKTRTRNDGVVVPVLTCGDCSRAYAEYRDEAIKSIARDPENAPASADKFSWVLSKIDLAAFEAEAATAVQAYRTAYETHVLPALRKRGYLDGEPVWEGGRVRMRFTRTSFSSGEAEAVKRALQEKDEMRRAYAAMRRTSGRLEVAARVKAELEEKLRKAAAPAAEPASAEA